MRAPIALVAAGALLATGPLVAGAASAPLPVAEAGALVIASSDARPVTKPASVATFTPATTKLPTGKSRTTPVQRLERLIAQLADVKARLDAAEAEASGLTTRRSQLGEEIPAAVARRSAGTAAKKAASMEVATSGSEVKAAKVAQAGAIAAQEAAAAESDAAAQVDAAARSRLEEATKQAAAARTAVKRAVTKVDKAKGKAYATAFTAWQMAAIADRVGRARSALAEQQATEAALGLTTAATALSAATDARTRADDRMARASAAAQTATERLAAATAEHAAAKEQLATLRAERTHVSEVLATATAQVTQLEAEVAVLSKQVARARATAAAAEAAEAEAATKAAAAKTATKRVTP